MLAMAVLLTVQAYRMPVDSSGKTELDEEFGAEATGVDSEVMANTPIWIVVGVLVWLMMEYIAFEVSMTLMLFGIFFFLRVTSYVTMAILAIATPLVLSQLVFYLFNTVMPAVWR